MGCELVREMLKSFARLFKGGAVKGARPCRATQSAKALRGVLFFFQIVERNETICIFFCAFFVREKAANEFMPY